MRFMSEAFEGEKFIAILYISELLDGSPADVMIILKDEMLGIFCLFLHKAVCSFLDPDAGLFLEIWVSEEIP